MHCMAFELYVAGLEGPIRWLMGRSSFSLEKGLRTAIIYSRCIRSCYMKRTGKTGKLHGKDLIRNCTLIMIANS